MQHPEGAPEKFQQAVGAGKGPDIFCWPHDRVGEWAKAGLIVPLRPNKAIRDEIEEPPGTRSATKASSGATRSPSRPMA